MKRKKSAGLWYQNPRFLSGFILSSIMFLSFGTVLYSVGVLKFAEDSSAYANSLSPRKSGPSWYTPPTPDPNGADQVAPVVSFVLPLNGSNVDPATRSGSYYLVPFEVSASDNDRIAHLAYYVNGVLDGLMYYDATVYKGIARVPNQAGTYVIKAIAYDYNGNPGEATTSVIVPKRK